MAQWPPQWRSHFRGVVRASDTPEIFELPELVVTATRTENTAEKVPASTQVITQADLQRSGSYSVRNALSNFANIFQKPRVRGGGHDVIIRGMDTDKSLILINGRRVANEADASGLGNAMALDRINISDIERIEIVRGPSSALYGSEAMGGVVNIITKASKEPLLSTGLEFTSDDASHWWHADTGRIGKFSATVDMRFNRIKRQMESDASESNQFGAAQTYNVSMDYHFSDNNYLNVFADYYSQHLKSDTGESAMKPITVTTSRGGVSLSGQAVLDGVASRDYKQQNYGLSWNKKTNRNDWQIRAYMSKFERDSTRSMKVLDSIAPAGPMGPMFTDLLNKQYNSYDFNHDKNSLWAIEGRDTMKLGDHHRLTFGAEYVENKIEGTGLGSNGDQVHGVLENGTPKSSSEKEFSTYAGYIQDEMEYGKWFIVPALRYDHHEIYGSHVSPKLGVTYSANDHFRVKANYGDGFKAPTVSQLYYDLDMNMKVDDGKDNWVHLTGNPDLKPEESTSWDLGVEAEFGKGYGALTYFDNHVDNLIESVYIRKEDNGHSLYQYRNVNKARIKGVENTLGYRFNDVLEFKVISTWLDAKDTTNDKDLTKRAKLSQIYQLIYDDHKDKGWSAMLWNQFDYKYVTDRAGNGTPGEKKSYSLTNFTLTRKVNKDTRIYGSIFNMFDKVDDDCDLDGRFYAIGWEHKF